MQAKFIYHDDGSFQIEIDGIRSSRTSYGGIARLAIDPCKDCEACRENDFTGCRRPGRTFHAVSNHFDGYAPVEQAFEIMTIPTSKED